MSILNKKETVREYIENHKYFSLSQIIKDTNLNKKIVLDYLSQLKQTKSVFEAGHGIYSSIETVFQLSPESRVETLLKHLKRDFPYTDFLIWNTKQLQSLYHHTQQHHITFIEVEKDSVQAFFEKVSKEYRDTIIEKRSKLYYDTFDISRNPVIVRNLISRSLKNKYIPLIEKILVDIFMDINNYKYISISDYWKIWESICLKYRINIGFVYNYSKRRKCFPSIFNKIIDIYSGYGIDLRHLIEESGKNL